MATIVALRRCNNRPSLPGYLAEITTLAQKKAITPSQSVVEANAERRACRLNRK